ncbi:MAG: hypothetical protein ACYCV6_11365 [Steroidobacteraceae bacterium]
MTESAASAQVADGKSLPRRGPTEAGAADGARARALAADMRLATLQ